MNRIIEGCGDDEEPVTDDDSDDNAPEYDDEPDDGPPDVEPDQDDDRDDDGQSDAQSSADEGLRYCSFCEKSEREVEKLITSPYAYSCICSECVDVCYEIVHLAPEPRRPLPLSKKGVMPPGPPPSPPPRPRTCHCRSGSQECALSSRVSECRGRI